MLLIITSSSLIFMNVQRGCMGLAKYDILLVTASPIHHLTIVASAQYEAKNKEPNDVCAIAGVAAQINMSGCWFRLLDAHFRLQWTLDVQRRNRDPDRTWQWKFWKEEVRVCMRVSVIHRYKDIL